MRSTVAENTWRQVNKHTHTLANTLAMLSVAVVALAVADVFGRGGCDDADDSDLSKTYFMKTFALCCVSCFLCCAVFVIVIDDKV